MNTQLSQALRRWSLTDPQSIAQTATSHVYRVQYGNTVAVLKLLTPLGVHDEATGAHALRYFGGDGAARLLNASDDAHLIEYLAGDDLLPMVAQGDDDRAAQIIAQVVARLHRKRPHQSMPTGLPTLRRRFRSLFRRVQQDADPLLQQGAQVAVRLLAQPQAVTVLHGDLHHGNIRQSARGYLAFDPKGILGERSYDVANALLNPFSLPYYVHDEARLLRHAHLYATALEQAPARIIDYAFAHACLSASWSRDSDTDDHHSLQTARLLAPHVG